MTATSSMVEHVDVQLMASELQMAYLPSFLLCGSFAAVRLSNSSKTDSCSQPPFSFKLLLLRHRVKWMVKCHGFTRACSVGWWTDRWTATDTRHCQQQSHQFNHNSNCLKILLCCCRCCVEIIQNFEMKNISREMRHSFYNFAFSVINVFGPIN